GFAEVGSSGAGRLRRTERTNPGKRSKDLPLHEQTQESDLKSGQVLERKILSWSCLRRKSGGKPPHSKIVERVKGEDSPRASEAARKHTCTASEEGCPRVLVRELS